MRAWFCYERMNTGNWSPVVWRDRPRASVNGQSRELACLTEVEIAEPLFDGGRFEDPNFAALVAAYPRQESP